MAQEVGERDAMNGSSDPQGGNKQERLVGADAPANAAATAAAREIISASRRTDIPAYFSDWFLRRLEAGWCEYWHAFSKRWFRVSLRAEEVAGVVFWTKNPGPLLPGLDAVRARFPFYVHFTITGHPRQMEPGVIPWQEAVTQAQEISRRFGPDALVWRFDPLVFTQLGGEEDALARFRQLAARLEGATGECVVSFMSPYRRQRRAFGAAGLIQQKPGPETRRALPQRLAEVAGRHGMSVTMCCNDESVGESVGKAHCIDPERLRRVGAELPARVPPAPSRPQCGCRRSLDIGAYDLCAGGCVYCYANQDHDLAARNRLRHRPEHVALAEAALARPGA